MKKIEKVWETIKYMTYKNAKPILEKNCNEINENDEGDIDFIFDNDEMITRTANNEIIEEFEDEVGYYDFEDGVWKITTQEDGVWDCDTYREEPFCVKILELKKKNKLTIAGICKVMSSMPRRTFECWVSGENVPPLYIQELVLEKLELIVSLKNTNN